MAEFADLGRALLPHVRAAGCVIMKYFQDGCAVEQKASGSPVTAADRDAEAILVAALRQIAPRVPVVAEEMAEQSPALAAGREFFLVDPLDGTREFISGRPEFTVNIGLVRDGTPCFGIVYVPALSTIYMTVGEGHAIRAPFSPDAVAPTGTVELPQSTRLRVNTVGEGQPLVVSASRSHGSDELEAWLLRITVKARSDAGSSLKFCQVASGDADIYPRFGTTMEWDTAAGHALVLAAGGIVSMRDGEPLRYGKVEVGLRNPHFIAAARFLPGLYERRR